MTYSEDRVRNLVERRIPWSSVVAVVEVGSTVHGVTSSDTGDDLDLTIVYLEPSFTDLVWTHHDASSPALRTQPDGVRSRMGDIDINLYSVRKFAGLMLKGNPSILGSVFSPIVHRESAVWRRIKDLHRRYVTSVHPAGDAFQGYMTQQIERWRGERGQKNVSRPELVERYGYDTKYAYHAIRLGVQGCEYMLSGKITLPMTDDWRTTLLGVREGTYTEPEALRLAESVRSQLKDAIVASPLPQRPNTTGLKFEVVGIYYDWSRTHATL